MLRIAFLCLVLILSGSAYAVPVPCTTMSALDQFIGLSASGGCFVQDKLFTDFSYTGGGDVAANAVNVATAFDGAGSIHGFTLTPSPGNPVWTSDFTFGYTITITSADPLLGIVGASLQINLGVLPNPASATSTKSNGLVQNASYGSTTDIDLFAPVSSIVSSTAVTIPTGGFVISLEEHYVQGIVPEPHTLLLLGGGLTGLAMRSSARRRAGRF